MRTFRNYLNIVESRNLFEAVNYEDMFNDVKRLMPLFDDAVQAKFMTGLTATIDEARKTLKKNDRVVWFLRLYKVGLMHELALQHTREGTTPEQIEAISTAWEKALAILAQKSGGTRETVGYDTLKVYREARSCLRNLAHYLSLPIAAIQNHVFSFETYGAINMQFHKAEQEWQAATSELIPYDPNEGEVIIKFPDGWFWQDLGKGACSKEGKAMGHCGNVPSQRPGDRVLSLRKMVKHGNQNFVRPSLTFILDGRGYLGEMKGRANNKPDPKYHPYIIALLKSDYVEGIKGGGYAPEQNFSLNDLDDATRDALIEEKPKLGTLRDYIKKNGIDEHVTKTIEASIDQCDWLDEGKTKAAVGEWKDFKDLVDSHGNRTAQWVASVISGEDDITNDYYWSDEAAENVLDDLPKETVLKIGHYLSAHYEEEIKQWEEDNDEEWNDGNTDAIMAILKETDDEVLNDLKRAAERGANDGVHKQMSKALEDAIDGIKMPFGGRLMFLRDVNADTPDNGKFEETGFAYDTPVYYVIPTETLADIVSNEGELENFNYDVFSGEEITIYERTDFDDYDDEGAVEGFFEEHPDWRAETKWQKRRKEEELKKQQLAAIDATGWRVELDDRDHYRKQFQIYDPEGNLVATRSAYSGYMTDQGKDEMLRNTIWDRTYRK